jgi:hypothetical protein
MRALIERYSTQTFVRALGNQAEMMFDAALPTVGFMPKAKNVSSWSGRTWEETDHDLDRVYERDGVAYGAEMKNTLDYIERKELEIKLAMRTHLGLKPLFTVRMLPKNYIEMVRAAGGFSLIFKWQLYPYGHADFAREVRQQLELPVDCPQTIKEGTVRRFLNWHLKEHGLGRA